MDTTLNDILHSLAGQGFGFAVFSLWGIFLALWLIGWGFSQAIRRNERKRLMLFVKDERVLEDMLVRTWDAYNKTRR